MDYLSSGYSTPARIYADSDDTVTIRWYRAAPGARVYTGWHAFGSTVFDDDYFPDNIGPGEVPNSRTWSPSVRPIYPGTADVESPDTLLHGISANARAHAPLCFDAQLAFAASWTPTATEDCLATEALGDLLLEDLSGCILVE